jgi:calcineurin-like phosphoesterase family protein
MTNYYIADPHFGHDKVIGFAGRPFHSAREMDSKILANINAAVTPDDDLWILGDFGFGLTARADGYLEDIHSKIACRTHLVVGNHDSKRVLGLPWDSVQYMAEIKDETRHVTLCHYPMLTWNKARKGSMMLFGHVHERWRGSRNCVNVGVDVWDFKPVTLRQAMRRASKLPVNPLWSDVEHGSPAPGDPGTRV